MKNTAGFRTASSRKRAGSRKNKRIRNVPSFASDFPYHVFPANTPVLHVVDYGFVEHVKVGV